MNDGIHLVCDNCSVNKKLSWNLGIPPVGCNSYKLNLAVQMFFDLNLDNNTASDNATDLQLYHHALFKQLGTLMSKLKAINGKVQLCEYTTFVVIEINEIKWCENY